MIVNNYDTSLVLGMCILNEVCYLTTSIGAIYFFYNGVIISREHLKRSICQGHSVYFTVLNLQPSILSVLDSRKMKSYFY